MRLHSSTIDVFLNHSRQFSRSDGSLILRPHFMGQEVRSFICLYRLDSVLVNL